MLARFEFTVALADLLFELLSHEINGSIEVAFGILGEQIGTRNSQAYRATESPFRNFGMIMFEGDSGVNGKAVQVL